MASFLFENLPRDTPSSQRKLARGILIDKGVHPTKRKSQSSLKHISPLRQKLRAIFVSLVRRIHSVLN